MALQIIYKTPRQLRNFFHFQIMKETLVGVVRKEKCLKKVQN